MSDSFTSDVGFLPFIRYLRKATASAEPKPRVDTLQAEALGFSPANKAPAVRRYRSAEGRSEVRRT
jgi:hypothetical protein